MTHRIQRLVLTLALAAAVAALVSLALTGCTSRIDAGTVTAKTIEPAHNDVSIVNCGKGCFVPVTYYDDEDYRLDIRDGDNEGYLYVTRESFDAVNVGDRVDGSPE